MFMATCLQQMAWEQLNVQLCQVARGEVFCLRESKSFERTNRVTEQFIR